MSKTSIHLNGSVNLPTSADVFSTVGKIGGERLKRVPDGEPGPRRQWIGAQYLVLRSNYYIETTVRQPHNQYPPLKLRDGAPEDFEIGALGYEREAKVSYADFLHTKSAGLLAEKTRFQISLPTPAAAVTLYVVPDSQDAIEKIYEKAMLREVAAICQAIPHRDLAIQWDVCQEMVMFDGRWGKQRWSNLEEALTRRFRDLAAAVQPDVELGFHLCYGDLDAKHFVEPIDAGKLVEMVNLLTKVIERPIHWVHLPVPIERDDEAYFAPLRNLRVRPETEIVLGLVHLKDGIEGTKKRIIAAQKVLPNFAIATECGIGRSFPPERIEELLNIHASAAEFCDH